MGSIYRRKDSKNWWISFSDHGRQFSESARTTRKAEAKALLAKREAEIFAGTFFPEKRKRGLTFAGLRDRWFNAKGGKGSAASDRTRFDTIVEHFGASTSIATIRQTDVEGFKDALQQTITRRGKPMANATVNRHLALLRSALKLVEREFTHRDPMHGVDFLSEQQRDRLCEPEELEGLLAEANPKLGLVITLGYYTGMRLGEITSLRWDQIDLDRRVITLDAADTKTNEPRRVPLAVEAVDELKAYPRRIDGRLLDVASTSMSPLFSRLVRKLAKAARKQDPKSEMYQDLRLHDLRHTAATHLRRAGADIFTIAKITGHKSIEMLRRYQEFDESDLVEAVDRVTVREGRRRG